MQAIDASENVDFNLHTHVECNSPLLPDSKTIVISTHALTWSATLSLFLFIRFLAISTHALTWSATLLSYALTPTNEFQLTHSRGVRRISIPDDFFPVKFQLTHSRGVRL